MRLRQSIARRRARRIQASLLALGFTFASCSLEGGTQELDSTATLLEAELDATPLLSPGADAAGPLGLAPIHAYMVSTTQGMHERAADAPPAYVPRSAPPSSSARATPRR